MCVTSATLRDLALGHFGWNANHGREHSTLKGDKF